MSRRRAARGNGSAEHHGNDNTGSRAREQHWSLVDVVAMIIAAFRIILPLVLVLLAAAAGAYGLFMLAFG
jgi:hypothetical protein